MSTELSTINTQGQGSVPLAVGNPRVVLDSRVFGRDFPFLKAMNA